ncbi:glycerophosphodiester phosphodiesterase family protein [Roseibium sp. SCPC15]|uniref:glycerophosphodiester phosphodiesterase n=1 Tax=Roseibium sp. SCP15 TaxID=3141376 RepID=UPI0033363AE9
MTSFQPDRTWFKAHSGTPLSIAHRGASAYAWDNTLDAFQRAHELGADMWEVDVRLTADGIPVAFHDADLKKTCGVDLALSDVTAARLIELTEAAGRPAPMFAEVAALAAKFGTGIYLDAKEADAASMAIAELIANRIERVIVGANTPAYCAELLEKGCAYPVSILVGLDMDPFLIADQCGAEIVHPCWERAGDRPDQLLDDAFFANAERRGLPVVIWHEERKGVVEALVKMPVLGICSDQPEMIARYKFDGLKRPEIVCHRGACKIAPENTRSAAQAAWGGGFDYVEIDVRETADGQVVVHHDVTLDRTTTGEGPLADKSSNEIAELDAGSWFSSFFQGEKVPELSEILDQAQFWQGKLYVEIKQANPISVVEAVFHRLSPEDVFFWSFNQKSLLEIRENFPEARLMARPEDYENLEDCLNAFGADIIEFNVRNANAADFEAVRNAGRKTMAAYMGSDPEIFDKLFQLQPDILNINEPFLVQRMLSQKEHC